jgi:glyoxylase-like metal-dependent hydrolase (beta-lactamase superfamily II)
VTTQARAAGQRGLWSRIVVGEPEPIGAGAWAMRSALPRHGINVFFIAEDGGVALFDSGSREIAGELKRLAAPHGGITRVVLSHSHFDHRGSARRLGAEVLCHPHAVAEIEGDGGRFYPRGSPRKKLVKTHLMSILRDAGPVRVDGTVAEGDRIGSFTVLDLPGHAKGQIGLWREEDRAIIVADAFYTRDPQTALYPYSLYGQDDDLAAATLRRIAALEPRTAWPGHGPALEGDVAGALERALAAAGRR